MLILWIIIIVDDITTNKDVYLFCHVPCLCISATYTVKVLHYHIFALKRSLLPSMWVLGLFLHGGQSYSVPSDIFSKASHSIWRWSMRPFLSCNIIALYWEHIRMVLDFFFSLQALFMPIASLLSKGCYRRYSSIWSRFSTTAILTLFCSKRQFGICRGF